MTRRILNTTTIGSLAVIIAATLWSADGLLRTSLYSLPAATIVFWEHMVGFLFLLPILLAKKVSFSHIKREDWIAMAVVSFLSGAVGTILYTQALLLISYIPFSVVVLLQQLQPLFAIGAAAILLREPLGKAFWGLTAVALVAAYLISFPTLSVNLSTGDKTWVAALFAVGAAASWGISTALSKYALTHLSVLTTTSIRFFLTALFSLGFVLLQGNAATLGTLSIVQWQTVVLITVSTGLVALALYYAGLQRIPASRSTLLELTWPLSAVLIGVLFLGETITFTQGFGSLLLIGTMVMIVRNADRIRSLTQPV